ncbi:hypothetical protein S40288_10942 [Stachybotrys chartarum IBT 40288]|nr:hypothetical protein S40288_10942 [Stachybotrys chartarum IBT 40288]
MNEQYNEAEVAAALGGMSVQATTPTPETFPQFGTRQGRLSQLTLGTFRLIWHLDGPIETAVYVIEDLADPLSPRHPYSISTPDGMVYHPIGETPLIEPRVSSITVKMTFLDEWEERWLLYHDHAEPGDGESVFGYDIGYGPELLVCCGERRPRFVPLEVTAMKKPYVTIHDYVMMMHPWLMSLLDGILWMETVWEGMKAPQGERRMLLLRDPADAKVVYEFDWQEENSRMFLPLRARSERDTLL